MNNINDFLDYDDKLEIRHEMRHLMYTKLERDEAMQDDDCDRRQDDSEEYRWYNE